MFDLNQFSEFQPSGMCFKGGGGSSSGKVGFPAYMETLHSAWLDDTATDSLVISMVDAMNAAHGSSPWTALNAYDPDTDIAAWTTALANFKALLAASSDTVDWAALYEQADMSIDGAIEADIAASIAAFTDEIDADIDSKVLPRFRRGMQDINAVVSSAYPIGAAIIEAERVRDVTKHSTSVRLNLMDRKANLIIGGTEQMVKMMLTRFGHEESYAKAMVESGRIKIVAKNEQDKQDASYDESDALWDLEVFQYGANLLGAIGSGVVKPAKTQGPTTAQSVLGGAMSGAAMGSMIPGVGTVVGGILGAASGLL